MILFSFSYANNKTYFLMYSSNLKEEKYKNTPTHTNKTKQGRKGVIMPWYVLSCLWDDAYKKPLLLIGKSSPCGGSGFPLSLSQWSFTICLTPYNRNYNVLSASLNKIFPPPRLHCVL